MIRPPLIKLLGAAALVVLIMPGRVDAADDFDPKEAAARQNLKRLAHGLDRYMRYNDGRLPAKLSDLYAESFILDLDAFVSPASGGRISNAKEIDDKADYYLNVNRTSDQPLVLLKEKKGLHGGQALAYYSDRTVRKEEPGFPPELLVAGKFPVSTQVKVPALVGLSAAEANKTLRAAGLAPQFELGPEAPTAAQAQSVFAVRPAAGDSVEKGAAVKVTLYGPVATVAANQAAVPRLAGLSAKAARELLEKDGLTGKFQLGPAAPAAVQALLVADSRPAAGERVARGSEVLVTLYGPADGKPPEPPSATDQLTIPDCLTLSVDEASAKLKAAGFAVSSRVGRAATFPGQIERVYEMEPAFGARVPRGQEIRLIIFGNRDGK